jgi:excisionase family DNA binding protein
MNTEINSPRLLALSEVSQQTSLSRSTLYREIDAGRLKIVKIGKSVRVTDQALRDYIASLGSVAQL